ncbi:MAG: chitobiase/beta-hexosaminidase C-terminal domain-containing protein [Prevotella sp.]|nr:chitobiase/beta-hexosaminidase C-terminal domain-containing protein [Prevotella sp.]
MKRLLTLAALLMLVLGINAQDKKTWDFTQGLSEETVANLNADAANWASNGTDATSGLTNNWKNNNNSFNKSNLMANGVVIPETAGLIFDIGSNKSNSIHLAQNKIRLTRKNTVITFPQLTNGQTITIVGRSANGTATNRGIAPVQSYLKFQADESSPQYNGACIFLGNTVEGSEGTYTFVWKVETDSAEPVDVQFKLTPDGGIDFTLFMIDKGDAPSVEEAQPVAYIYDGSLDEDYGYVYLEGSSDKFILTPVDASNTEETAETLRSNYTAVVVSPTIGADHPYLSTIKQTIAYVPVLNFNTAIYEALGYGKAVASTSNILSVMQENETLFEGIDTTEGIELLSEGVITGVELGEYFAADDIIATAGDVVAMHIHNAKRNAYMLLPLSIADMAVANDIIAQLIPNALSTLIATKRDVVAVGKPAIATTQENGSTTVSLSANNSNKIYYTIDGSDPTVESTLYTEPFTLTEAATVKAFATGDGYTDSEIASKDVIILTQASTPVISVAQEEGKSVVTISSDLEGVTIYYNYTGSNVLTESAVYTQAIELTQPTKIYAFAVGGNYLASEVGSQFVGINGIDKNTLRWDVVSHFDANADEWKGKGQQTDADGNIINANYFFTWGKNAGAYWDETSAEDGVDEDGNPITVYTRTLDPEVYEAGDWRIKSIGQVMTWESLDYKFNIGDTNYRNPDAAEDVIGVNDKEGITRDAITFGKQPSGGPFNASLESTVPFQAPFDVVIYAGNGNDGEIPTMQVETSADGETWTKLGDVNYSLIKRNWKKTHLSYEGTDKVYVRILHTNAKSSGQVYDLYIMNNGEYSQGHDDITTAISDVQSSDVVRTEVYSLNGVRANAAARGISIVRTTYADGKVVTRKVVK